MSPTEHLLWLEDNTRWFSALPVEALTAPVPACPGWDVEYVLNHLATGLGLAYPYGMRTPPGQADMFGDVPWPATPAVGQACLDNFSAIMADCLAAFRSADPDMACQTYMGPGRAAFWFRRAAIETTLHRMDVAHALDQEAAHLTSRQASDAIAESVDLVLPFAAAQVGDPNGSLHVTADGVGDSWTLGAEPPLAQLSGPPGSVLAALWGRVDSHVEISGSRVAAQNWTSLVEAAFAGR